MPRGFILGLGFWTAARLLLSLYRLVTCASWCQTGHFCPCASSRSATNLPETRGLNHTLLCSPPGPPLGPLRHDQPQHGANPLPRSFRAWV